MGNAHPGNQLLNQYVYVKHATSVLGKGTLMRHQQQGNLIFVEQVIKQEQADIDALTSRLKYLQNLQNDAIVKLIGFETNAEQTIKCSSERQFTIAFEFFETKQINDIEFHRSNEMNIHEDKIVNMIEQIVEALHYLFQRQSPVTAITSEHIFIDNEQYKLAIPHSKVFMPLKYYYSQRQLEEMRLKKPQKVTYKDLVFQFGMVVLESMTLQSQHMCYDYDRHTLKIDILQEHLNKTQNYSQPCIDILILMLKLDEPSQLNPTELKRQITNILYPVTSPLLTVHQNDIQNNTYQHPSNLQFRDPQENPFPDFQAVTPQLQYESPEDSRHTEPMNQHMRDLEPLSHRPEHSRSHKQPYQYEMPQLSRSYLEQDQSYYQRDAKISQQRSSNLSRQREAQKIYEPSRESNYQNYSQLQPQDYSYQQPQNYNQIQPLNYNIPQNQEVYSQQQPQSYNNFPQDTFRDRNNQMLENVESYTSPQRYDIPKINVLQSTSPREPEQFLQKPQNFEDFIKIPEKPQQSYQMQSSNLSYFPLPLVSNIQTPLILSSSQYRLGTLYKYWEWREQAIKDFNDLKRFIEPYSTTNHISNNTTQDYQPSYNFQEVVTDKAYPDGFYSGQFSGFMRQGYGRMKYNNGSYYEGDWQHDTMTGKGTLYTEDNEAAYIGEWKDNLFHGKGTLYNAQVQMAQNPDFRNLDTMQNCWTKYEGDFNQDMQEGSGVLYFVNGDRFQGVFFQDHADGPGQYIFKDGRVINATWRNNQIL